jgi:hypothetical protein
MSGRKRRNLFCDYNDSRSITSTVQFPLKQRNIKKMQVRKGGLPPLKVLILSTLSEFAT